MINSISKTGAIFTSRSVISNINGNVRHVLKSENSNSIEIREIYFSELRPRSTKAWKFHAKQAQNLSGCKNLKGATADFDLNLDTCFENRDGVLRKGVGFAKTCTGCTMETKTTILKCTCENAQGKKVAAQVDINSFITNSDGKLTC